MSQDLASLYIKIDSSGVVTASKDLAALEGQSKKVEKATDSVSRGFSGLRTAVLALASSYAALKLAQYIEDATKLAARYETLGVVMRVVGANAGYSGKQMDSYAVSLQKAGIAQVESRNTLARMIQAQIDLTNASKLARIAQDSAVIGNMNSSKAFEQMIYGIQTGMPRILRTIGLNVDFEASERRLAEALGVKQAALNEAQVMQARTNAVIKSGILIEGTYEAAMSTAGKRALSLERHMDNLKVAIGAAFTPAYAEIIQAITGAVTDLNGELSGESKEKIADWGNSFRLTIMSIEAEIMRLSMFIDKVGGTMTSAQMLLYGPGAWLGIESSTKRFEAAAQANIELEARYKATEKALEELAVKYNELEQAMTPAGKAAAKQAQEEAEAKVLALQKIAKAEKDAEAAAEARREEEKGAIKEAMDDFDAYAKAYWNFLKDESDAINAGRDDFEKYLQDNQDAREDFSDKYRQLILGDLEYEKQKIRDQGIVYEEAGADRIDIEKWVTSEIKRLDEKALEAQKKDLDALGEYWQHTMDNIHDATADSFYQIFSNIEDGFQAVFDNIKTWFLKLLAEMAATAIARPIILPIVTGVASALGMSGTASASGGGLFDFSGLSSLASIGSSSSGWGVAGGIIESGDFLEWSDTAINWANVAGYIGLAYNAYSFFQSIGDQEYLSAAGTALGTAIGAFTGGGPVGAAIGASIGNLVGGILDSVFGLGESAPEFTLSEMNTKYGAGAGPGAAYDTTKWTKGAGLSTGYFPEYSSDWEATPTVAHTAIAKAYAKGRKEITENFNGSMTSFMEALPSEYLTVVEDALAGMDFTYLVSSDRWEFEDAQSVIENLLLNYADFLSGKFDEVVNVIGAAYFEQDIATSDLYSKLSSGKQGAVSDLLTGGGLTGEEFNTFLTDWNTLLGVMASFEEFVNPAAASLSTYEQVTQSVGDQFDAYIDTLERAGVEVSKLGDLEQMRADTIEREVTALQGDFWTSFTEEMTLLYSGMSDVEKETYKLKQSFEEYYQTAVDLGMSEEYLAQIREWEATALAQLTDSATAAVTAIDDISSALDRISELAGKIAGQSADDIRMTMISQRYGWSSGTYGTPSTGYNWDRIMAVYQQGFGLEDLQRIAASLGIDWTTIADDIEYLVDKFWAMKASLTSLTASLEDQYAQLTMSDRDYAVYQAQAQLDDTREQIDALYQRGIMTTQQYNYLSNLALSVYWETVNQLTDEAGDNIDSTVEAASRAWHSLIDNIKSSILDLTTSSDNQADAVERLGIAAQAIRDYTGGASISSYLSGLSNDEDRRSAIESIMDMYGTYLGVAQEAYQRPSSEYQAVYQEVLSAYQMMEGIAEGYVSDYDIQLQQLAALQSIANNTATIGGYAAGTDYVPKTGIYMLHQGEKVVKAGEGGGGPVYFSLTINGSNMNPREARQEFETFLTSNRGRKIVQQAAARH